MSAPEDPKPEETKPIPTWQRKSNSFFGNLKQTILMLARLERDDTAKYYGDLSDECFKLYKPSLLEIYKKGRKIEGLPFTERANPANYETEEEKTVVRCLNVLQNEKIKHFTLDFEERQVCYSQCEREYPEGKGPMNFYWRHSCKRDCEKDFTKNVKPKIKVLRQYREEQERAEKEKIDE